MIPLDRLLNISSGFGQNCKFLFFTIFCSFCFSLRVSGNYHKLEFLLHSLWMAWNLTCWCILTTSELIRFFFIICCLSSFWHHFVFVKQDKFASSCPFLENAREEWPELRHADVSWPPLEPIELWSWSVDFPHFGGIQDCCVDRLF